MAQVGEGLKPSRSPALLKRQLIKDFMTCNQRADRLEGSLNSELMENSEVLNEPQQTPLIQCVEDQHSVTELSATLDPQVTQGIEASSQATSGHQFSIWTSANTTSEAVGRPLLSRQTGGIAGLPTYQGTRCITGISASAPSGAIAWTPVITRHGGAGTTANRVVWVIAWATDSCHHKTWWCCRNHSK